MHCFRSNSAFGDPVWCCTYHNSNVLGLSIRKSKLGRAVKGRVVRPGCVGLSILHADSSTPAVPLCQCDQIVRFAKKVPHCYLFLPFLTSYVIYPLWWTWQFGAFSLIFHKLRFKNAMWATFCASFDNLASIFSKNNVVTRTAHQRRSRCCILSVHT